MILFDEIVKDEILQGKCYPEVPMTGEVRTVVDIGANVGIAALMFAHRWPEAMIYCYEPDLDAFAGLCANTRGSAKIRTMPVGVYRISSKQKLFQGRHGSVTNSIKRSSLNYGNSYADVQLVGTDQLPADIDVLKIDTEGCEVEILKGLEDRFGEIGLIYLEFHSDSDREEIHDILSETHSLCRGNISDLHRGELTYILYSRLPEDAHYLKIE